ncbi:Uncharacterised protein [Mycobacteroides abscessus subsp. abscessus]|nr:Uncharacterised protein [Mycobacteroides abscessus subsp. abscessus]
MLARQTTLGVATGVNLMTQHVGDQPRLIGTRAAQWRGLGSGHDSS